MTTYGKFKVSRVDQLKAQHKAEIEALQEQLHIEQELTHEAIAIAVMLDNWLSLVSADVQVMQHAQSSQLIHEAQENIEKITAEYEAWRRDKAVGVLLEDTAVVAELDGHGIDRVGVS